MTAWASAIRVWRSSTPASKNIFANRCARSNASANRVNCSTVMSSDSLTRASNIKMSAACRASAKISHAGLRSPDAIASANVTRAAAAALTCGAAPPCHRHTVAPIIARSRH